MPTNITLALAGRVRDMMDLRGWTQDDLARKAKVSRRAVGYLLNYRDRSDRHPTLETTEKIASAFGTAVWKMLCPSDVCASGVSEPDPLDTELLTTSLTESADLFRRVNVLPTFEELAAVAVHMYDEVQTGIPMRRVRENVNQQLEQVRRGTILASQAKRSEEGSKRGRGNKEQGQRGKTRTR